MITPEKDYNELLYVINDPNNILEGEPVYYRIPSDEPIYEINLNTREVQAPEFLSVLEDHNAEVIWFKVDRFYDDVDLYGSTCWIQYKNALKEDFVAVTIPRVIVESNHDILYIPWPICGPATKAAGTITFSFQFFKMSEDKKRVFYSLHTKPATSKISHGLHVNPVEFIEGDTPNDSEIVEDWWNDPNISAQQAQFMKDYHILTEAYSTLSKDYELYWITV